MCPYSVLPPTSYLHPRKEAISSVQLKRAAELLSSEASPRRSLENSRGYSFGAVSDGFGGAIESQLQSSDGRGVLLSACLGGSGDVRQ